MKLNSATLTMALLFWACACASAGGNISSHRLMKDRAAYSDPSFQDFVETSYGYLNPAKRAAAGLRDAVAGNSGLIFVTVLPKGSDYSVLLEDMTAAAGFVLHSEQTLHSNGVRTVQLFGWARADSLNSILRNPLAEKVYIGKRI